MSTLQFFNYKNQVISRRKDGFINLTQMCKANGKRLDNYLRLKQTNEYIEVLSRSLTSEGTGQNSVLDTIQGGSPNEQGTWGHPTLAINLARWISAEFAVWCDQNIFTLIATGKSELIQQPTQIALPPEVEAKLDTIQEENRIIIAMLAKFGDVNEVVAKAIADKTKEKLDAYHAKKSEQFKRIKEQNEIERFLKKHK